MNERIKSLITSAAQNQAQSLDVMWPSVGKNGLNEAHIMLNMAMAFRQQGGPNNAVIPEVPFSSTNPGRTDNRFDLLLLDDDMVIAIECKRLYSIEGLDRLANDWSRLNPTNISSALARVYEPNPDRSVYRMIIAETWQPSVKACWMGIERDGWDTSWLPKVREAHHVWASRAETDLTWLYAFEKVDVHG